MSELTFLFLPIALILALVGIFTAFLFSNRWIWLAIICIFLSGFLMGFAFRIASGSLLSKFIVGFVGGLAFVIFIIPSSLLVKYYREKGREWLDKNNREKNRYE
jgi:hypothetical protein